jgi:hypothetical protein
MQPSAMLPKRHRPPQPPSPHTDAPTHPTHPTTHRTRTACQVELSAPGVDILSTISRNAAGASRKSGGLAMSPAPAGYDASINPGVADASGTGSVTAQLVDCGLGLSTCSGARGKVCLIQRGEAGGGWLPDLAWPGWLAGRRGPTCTGRG